jgi:hypothetical protein
MRLYHFTSRRHLRGISQHGLTVGDVPTDLSRDRGRYGVWLTTSPKPNGHGLEGGACDKKAIRLTIVIEDDAPLLFRWTEWAAKHATRETIEGLRSHGEKDENWWVYFGVLPPASIVECVDLHTGADVVEWPNIPQMPFDLPGVPTWRREAWHKGLLKRVRSVLARGEA